MTEENETAAAAEMNRLYRKTKEILAKNHDLLDGIAKLLCDKGVITAADISKIKENCRIVPVSI
jgi:ATP-dependent Zn protease